MSLRLEMLQVARLAPRALGEACGAVEAFVREQWNDDGGARDRAGASDLYYTVFATDAAIALQTEPPIGSLRRYLDGFGAGDDLDLVHLACLARCRAAIRDDDPAHSTAMRAGLERFRAADGGYANAPGAATGTAYHAFLAVGAHQDLGGEAPDPDALLGALATLRAADGGYANAPGAGEGTTTVTAAAVTLLRNLGVDAEAATGDWLLARAHPQGGFVATPRTPAPDLLSTATALHALSGLHRDLEPLREPCLDFVDSLWTGRAFCGHWADDDTDAEYCFYALLALGHLSV